MNSGEDDLLVTESMRSLSPADSGFAKTPPPKTDRMKYADAFNFLGFSIDPVDPKVRSLAERSPDKLTFFAVSGPAVKYMLFTLPLKFVFVVFFPVLAWAASSCASDRLYAIYPWWMWVVYMPGFLIAGWLEWECLKIVIVPYVQWVSPFNYFPRCTVSLRVWLVIQAIMSSTAKFDIAGSSLFFAKVITSCTCQESTWKDAQKAWEHALGKSVVFWAAPCLKHLLLMCLLGWAIIMLQVIVAFLMSYPLKGFSKTNYHTGGEQTGYTTLWNKCFGDSPKEWHADVLRIVADATRSRSIVELSCEWQMERVSKQLDQLEEPRLQEEPLRQAAVPASDGTDTPQTEELDSFGSDLKDQYRCFDMVFKETQRTSFRLWWINILEKAVIMETQSSMYSLIRATRAENDYQTLFALIVSFLCLAHALCIACFHLASLRSTHKKAVDSISKMVHPLNQEEQDNAEFETCIERWKTRLFCLPRAGTLPTRGQVLSQARRSKYAITLRMGLGIFVLFLILMHTFVKLVMAAAVCKYGLWNIPTPFMDFENYGCVDLSSIPDLNDNAS